MAALPLFRIELVQSDFKWLKKSVILTIPNQQAPLSPRNDKSAMWHNGKAFIFHRDHSEADVYEDALWMVEMFQ